ncbi:MAG: hypothetical protein IT365_16355 [Candidatus Hydrogenedentes bacterium]|nr:hypothetical protein [Candidatus Hydrogenedentota bacterium]
MTDPDSGAPVCPARVQAFWDKSVVWTSWLTSTTTDVDGFYTLSLSGLAGPERFWITAGYDHSKPVAEVLLEPGAAKELNLLVPSTVTATAYCVDDAGAPIEGLIVTTGGPTRMTDAGGRVTVYGLAPYASHTLDAYRPQEDSIAQGRTPIPDVRVGVSAPFSGKPGEAIPEVLIQCAEPTGSISGQLIVPEEVEQYWHDAGHDILHTQLFYEGIESYTRTASMDEEYRFTLGELDPGRCTVLVWLPTSRTKTPKGWWAEIENVEIVSGQNTGLGLVTLNVSDNWWQ